MHLDASSARPSFDLLIYAYVPLAVLRAQQQQGQLIVPPQQIFYAIYQPDTDPLLASNRALALNNNANYLTFDLQIQVALDGSSTYTYSSTAVPQGSFGLNASVFANTLNVTDPNSYELIGIYCAVTSQSNTVTTLEQTKVYDFSSWLSDLGGTISIIATVFGLVFPTLDVEARHLRFAKKWTERTRTATQQQSSENAAPPSSPTPSNSNKGTERTNDSSE